MTKKLLTSLVTAFTALSFSVLPAKAMGYKINFQPSQAKVPQGYLVDDGSMFNEDRGYGWDNDKMRGKERNQNENQTLDTFVAPLPSFEGKSTWEINVPNGEYGIDVTLGDPLHWRKGMYVDVEGKNFVNNVTTAPNNFHTGSRKVIVNDGKLTLTFYGTNQREVQTEEKGKKGKSPFGPAVNYIEFTRLTTPLEQTTWGHVKSIYKK